MHVARSIHNAKRHKQILHHHPNIYMFIISPSICMLHTFCRVTYPFLYPCCLEAFKDIYMIWPYLTKGIWYDDLPTCKYNHAWEAVHVYILGPWYIIEFSDLLALGRFFVVESHARVHGSHRIIAPRLISYIQSKDITSQR
jgi:hypothetical protein